MAGVKISNLPVIAAPAASDIFPVVQAGVTYKETVTQLGSLVLLLSGGTMTGNLILNGDPTLALQSATKQYVDSVAQGLTVQPACRVATTGALTATYSNGASGVGATLTNAGAFAAIVIDGVTLALNDRVLVKNQASTFQNGIYTVTTLGDGVSVNWVLTRATDFDTSSEIQPGDFVIITAGTVNTQTSWIQTATVVTVGTDAIVFAQFTSNPATFLKVASNLSDVGSQSTSWNNLFPTTEVTGATVALQVDHSYVMNRGTLITATLPSLALLGEIIEIAGVGAGGWLIAQNASQIIHVGSSASSTGVGGSVASTNRYDCIKLRCVVANLEFVVMSGTGNFTVV